MKIALVLALCGCGAASSSGDLGEVVPDDCTGVSCETPPAAGCVDGTRLRSYSSTGNCAAGKCSYSHFDVLCVEACRNGSCTGSDPCKSVVCQSPPSCLDDHTLRSYAGICSAGSCSYETTDILCDQGCHSGKCNGDPCAAVICNQPPLPGCLDSTTLRSYSATGTCSAAKCSYNATDTVCQHGCKLGACLGDACAGVNCNRPPAPACAGPSLLRRYAATGTCANGTCSYAPTDTPCAFGCSAGKCLPDPCSGVVCDQQPAPICADFDSLRSFSSTGTCNGGVCGYPSADSSCAYGCKGGVCNSGPRCSALKIDRYQKATAPSVAALLPAGSLTLEAWIYPTDFINGPVVAGAWPADFRAGSYLLALSGIGQLQFSLLGDGETSPTNAVSTALVPLNAWSHVAGVFDAGAKTMTAFLNGTPVVKIAVGFTRVLPPNPWEFTMGGYGWLPTSTNWNGQFLGYLDEVRLSSSARYSASFTPPAVFASDAATLLLYHFNESSGRIASDSSSTNDDASLVPGTTFAAPSCP